MANIMRVRVGWSGLVGLPGVSTFFTTNPDTMVPALWEFFTQIKALLPTGLVIEFPVEGDTIDGTSGALTGSWTTAAKAPVVGNAGGVYAAPVGAVINWLTGTVVNGHRLRGKTFIVPLAGSQYDLTGSLSDSALTYLREHSQGVITNSAGGFVIWSRPEAGAAGGFSVVTSRTVPDKACILRSRRD